MPERQRFPGGEARRPGCGETESVVMRRTGKIGLLAVAATLSVLLARPADALVDDPTTSFTAPAASLVMPFDATEGWVTFMIVSNIAGVTPIAGGEILGVTTHWSYWSDSCDHLVDVWVCMTLNDTIVVDPTSVSDVDVGNEQVGRRSNLSGFRGTVVVTAYGTDESCNEGSVGGYVPIDNAIVGAATRASTTAGYSFGSDAVGLGLDPSGSYVQLPTGVDPTVDIMTLNPGSVENSSLVLMSLSESAGNGPVASIEVGPNDGPKSSSLIFFDTFENPTSLPDVSFGCSAFTSIPDFFPESMGVDSSGIVRMLDVNDSPGDFVFALHGQAVGSFGGSTYGKYRLTASQ